MAGLVVMAVLVLGWPLLPWKRVRALLVRVSAWVGRQRPPRPEVRPIEQVALHARRLGATYRAQPRGISYVKYEAHRRAYDDVLVEGCQALGVTHLLTVLAPGPELDAERHRVEGVLELSGMDLNLPL